MPRMRLFEMRLIPLVAIAALALPAAAQAQEIKPLLDARLRWENVDQEGFNRQANAATFRLRAGAELVVKDWSLLAEGEVTAAPIE